MDDNTQNPKLTPEIITLVTETPARDEDSDIQATYGITLTVMGLEFVYKKNLGDYSSVEARAAAWYKLDPDLSSEQIDAANKAVWQMLVKNVKKQIVESTPKATTEMLAKVKKFFLGLPLFTQGEDGGGQEEDNV